MEKSKVEDMIEVFERLNEDSRVIVEFFEVGFDSYFFINVKRKGMIGNNCGINVDFVIVKYCVYVGIETEFIFELILKYFVDVGI